MTKIEAFFLKIKAWQFILLLCIPYFFTRVAVSIGVNDRQVLIVYCVIDAVFYAWLWILGNKLNNQVPKKIRVNSGFFRFCIFFSFAFVFYSILVEAGFGLIIPNFIDFFFLFCMIYVSYFVAKNLTMAEKYKIAGFLEIYILILLVFGWPIGIWFIQPRVNKLFKEKKVEGVERKGSGLYS
ncbi:MAG: hypothetical protein HOI47_21345 [Candidatus Scalindua sp.]|jgi:hypothetical protein|nr:hypothetical protein [Candidatus Scalindua sp.]MBT6229196.1 hypothetical protein [Candidatus Scalindua sp.]